MSARTLLSFLRDALAATWETLTSRNGNDQWIVDCGGDERCDVCGGEAAVETVEGGGYWLCEECDLWLR